MNVEQAELSEIRERVIESCTTQFIIQFKTIDINNKQYSIQPHVHITDAEQKEINYEMNYNENEASFVINYTPTSIGLYTVSIGINGCNLKKSPFSVNVLPLSYMEALLSIDVIKYKLLYFLPMKDLFILHSVNTRWRMLVGDYIEKTMDPNKREWILNHLPSFIPCICNDKELIQKLIKKDSEILSYISYSLMDEAILPIINENGFLFQYLSNCLKNNKEIAIAAVSNCGFAL